MTNEIPTLPREVAESIEALRKGYADYGIVVATYNGESYRMCGQQHNIDILRNYFGKLGGESLMSALVNGYRVERTPEDKLREYYATFDDLEQSGAVMATLKAETKRDAVLHTLKLLGITIDGVNGA